jgi:hypothetical protein
MPPAMLSMLLGVLCVRAPPPPSTGALVIKHRVGAQGGAVWMGNLLDPTAVSGSTVIAISSST